MAYRTANRNSWQEPERRASRNRTSVPTPTILTDRQRAERCARMWTWQLGMAVKDGNAVLVADLTARLAGVQKTHIEGI